MIDYEKAISELPEEQKALLRLEVGKLKGLSKESKMRSAYYIAKSKWLI